VIEVCGAVAVSPSLLRYGFELAVIAVPVSMIWYLKTGSGRGLVAVVVLVVGLTAVYLYRVGTRRAADDEAGRERAARFVNDVAAFHEHDAVTACCQL
jgi:uncharacterized membrane protein